MQSEMDLSMFSPNSQWELVETWAHRNTLKHSCCSNEVAQIQYDIHIKRLPQFYISNFILPCALIAALTAMVFLTPAGRWHNGIIKDLKIRHLKIDVLRQTASEVFDFTTLL